jgi:hypothetical protein
VAAAAVSAPRGDKATEGTADRGAAAWLLIGSAAAAAPATASRMGEGAGAGRAAADAATARAPSMPRRRGGDALRAELRGLGGRRGVAGRGGALRRSSLGRSTE